MDRKQKKILLTALGVVIGSFAVHETVLYIARLEQKHQQDVRDAEKARQKPPGPGPRVGRPIVVQLPRDQFRGAWEGKAVLADRGVCHLRVEIGNKDSDYTANSTFSCMHVSSMQEIASARTALQTQQALADRMIQDSAILSGKLEESGNIAFATQQNIGASKTGCAVSAITAIPFGTNRIAVEWKDGKCHGGSVILQRAAL